MPFFHPFKTKFRQGDLVYGLSEQRKKHIEGKEPFIDAFTILEESIAPTCLIDDYRTKREKLFTHYDNNHTHNSYKDSFFYHMKSNPSFKYHNVATNPQSCPYRKLNELKRKDFEKSIEDKKREEIKNWANATKIAHNKFIGRKCKMGLSWVCTSNDKLVENCHIHFILDDIDMEKLISKQDDNSITGKELRWIYRNRHDPRVAKKIQFWLDGKPVIPPWEFAAAAKNIERNNPLGFEEAFSRYNNYTKKLLKENREWCGYEKHLLQKKEHQENEESKLDEGFSKFFDKY